VQVNILYDTMRAGNPAKHALASAKQILIYKP